MDSNYTKPEYVNALIILLDMPKGYVGELNKLKKETLQHIYHGMIENAKAMNQRAESSDEA